MQFQLNEDIVALALSVSSWRGRKNHLQEI